MKKSLVDRFFEKVQQFNYVDSCWYWRGCLDDKGYGLVKRGGFGRHGSSIIRAHRLSWMIYKGPIPDGLCVCHTCDHPACVNPNHLFLGTMKDNCQDRDLKCRNTYRRGENHNLAKLTWNQVQTIKDLVLGFGMTRTEAANIYGISVTVVSKIIRGKSWKNQS